MFLLSRCGRPGFRLWMPDECVRIISNADLIYAPCRSGHLNDLPRHGCHQSPATRGLNKHGRVKKVGGTPKHPQGVYGPRVHGLMHTCFCGWETKFCLWMNAVWNAFACSGRISFVHVGPLNFFTILHILHISDNSGLKYLVVHLSVHPIPRGLT